MRFKIGISLILFGTSKGAKKNEDGIWRRGGEKEEIGEHLETLIWRMVVLGVSKT